MVLLKDDELEVGVEDNVKRLARRSRNERGTLQLAISVLIEE
jgi:hypothetical protein